MTKILHLGSAKIEFTNSPTFQPNQCKVNDVILKHKLFATSLHAEPNTELYKGNSFRIGDDTSEATKGTSLSVIYQRSR